MLPTLDPTMPIDRTTGRRLPHWAQEGTAVFFTFRLADSLPQSFLKRWEAFRHRLLLRHGVDPDAAAWANRLRDASPEAAAAYQRRRSLALLAALDRGHGGCVLQHDWASRMVLDAIRFFDGTRWSLGPLVVMPNHVHGIAAALPGCALAETLHRVKHFTARRINQRLEQTGKLWQHESFDRLVRNAAAYERAADYIRNNPRKLRAGTYRLWEPDCASP